MTPAKLRADALVTTDRRGHGDDGECGTPTDCSRIPCRECRLARAALALAELMPVMEAYEAACAAWDESLDDDDGPQCGTKERAEDALRAAWTKAKGSLQ